MLIAVAVVSFVIQALSNKEMARRFPAGMAGTFLYSAMGLSIIPLILAPFGAWSLTDPRTLLVAGVFGVDFAATMALMVICMREGPLSLTSLFVGLSVLLPVAAGALFFGEAMTALKVVGLVCVLAVVVLSSVGGGAHKVKGRWVVLALLMMACNGILSVLQKAQGAWLGLHDNWSFQFYGFLTASLCLWALLLAQKLRHKVSLTPWRSPWLPRVSAALGISTLVGNAAVMLALRATPAVVAFPIITGSLVLLTWIVSVAVYREPLRLKGLVSLLVGLTGIVLLSV